jgi:hypothetical protein
MVVLQHRNPAPLFHMPDIDWPGWLRRRRRLSAVDSEPVSIADAHCGRTGYLPAGITAA